MNRRSNKSRSTKTNPINAASRQRKQNRRKPARPRGTTTACHFTLGGEGQVDCSEDCEWQVRAGKQNAHLSDCRTNRVPRGCAEQSSPHDRLDRQRQSCGPKTVRLKKQIGTAEKYLTAIKMAIRQSPGDHPCESQRKARGRGKRPSLPLAKTDSGPTRISKSPNILSRRRKQASVRCLGHSN